METSNRSSSSVKDKAAVAALAAARDLESAGCAERRGAVTGAETRESQAGTRESQAAATGDGGGAYQRRPAMGRGKLAPTDDRFASKREETRRQKTEKKQRPSSL
ncbi:hypothetical protein L2E82_35904 [Cichorium intybus]|uniref:Uncharacterized protein n=1 Tax=Cichorium intybus TaxID=13427 RepID=A0ACB9BQ59_CICIN|nr:hypothetical protein L2E82_35904 [Cichorium intybus]